MKAFSAFLVFALLVPALCLGQTTGGGPVAVVNTPVASTPGTTAGSGNIPVYAGGGIGIPSFTVSVGGTTFTGNGSLPKYRNGHWEWRFEERKSGSSISATISWTPGTSTISGTGTASTSSGTGPVAF